MNKNIALNNLLSIDKVLVDLQVDYWLSCGTLLGLHRENDFIGHDLDTDICIPAKYLNKDLIERMTNEGFDILRMFGRLEDGFEITFTRNGVKTDFFFVYEKSGEDKIYHSVYADFNNTSGVKYDYIFDPIETERVEFKGHMFKVPKEREKVILQQYGEDWKIPNKKWRYNTSPANSICTNKRVENNQSIKDFKKLMKG